MSWVIERPDLAQFQDPNAQPRTRSSPRRPHTKSKLGCATCKQRRIKCDETRPTCSQCRDRNAQCVYRPRTVTTGDSRPRGSSTTLTKRDESETSLSPGSVSSPASSTSPHPMMSIMTFETEDHPVDDPVTRVVEQVARTVEPATPTVHVSMSTVKTKSPTVAHLTLGAEPVPMVVEYGWVAGEPILVAVEPMPRELAKARILMDLKLANHPDQRECGEDAYTRGDVPELFDHFSDMDEPWAGSSECQRVLQRWSPSLAVTHSFLGHAMLAFSASHLQSSRPQEKKYGVAAALHYGESIRGFSEALEGSVDQQNADALFATCYIHAMLALYNRSPPGQANSADNDFGWLRGMKGIPILQHTNKLRDHLNQSIWLPVFVESKAYSAEMGHLPTPTSRSSTPLPEIEALRRECDVSHLQPDNDENPYAIPLAHLDRLSRLPKITNRDIGVLMVFIARLPGRFVTLLEQLDMLAMKILALWCDYAAQVDQWWCKGPATQEAERLRSVLRDKESFRTPESLA